VALVHVYRVGAAEITATLRRWVEQEKIEHLASCSQPAQLDGVWLAIAATGDRALNAHVAACAAERDDRALSRFQVPAVVDHVLLTVAVSTVDAAPVLVRRVREQQQRCHRPSHRWRRGYAPARNAQHASSAPPACKASAAGSSV